MKKKLKILLTGGGSTGHVSPLLAVADALREMEPAPDLLFVGVRQGMEARVVPRENIKIKFAPSSGMPSRKASLEMFFWMIKLGFGVLKALFILLGYRPSVIMASGGFASAPSVFAASLLKAISLGTIKIPVYVHEQNAVPGRMNTLAAHMATAVGVSHDAAISQLGARNCEFVGYPVRGSFKTMDRAQARKDLGLSDSDEYVVVFGGSQGARTINRAIVDALPYLAKRKTLKIVHGCGTFATAAYHSRKDTEKRLNEIKEQDNFTPENYELHDYLHNLPLHLAAADLSVIRAGAGSLLEISALGLPAIVVPKANLPGDSQVANAREVAARDAIELIYEEPGFENGRIVEKIPGEHLADTIIKLLDNKERRETLSKNVKNEYKASAAKDIANILVQIAEDKEYKVKSNSKDKIKSQPIISPGNLRRKVEGQLGLIWEGIFGHGPLKPEELEKLEDIDYLHYRGSALIASSAWTLQNEGVKLLGLTGHQQRLDLLLHIVNDRTPDSRLKRMVGGDFRYVGFLRRNAIGAIVLIGIWDAKVRSGFVNALNDPYYEVRSWALKGLRFFADNELEKDNELVSLVQKCINDNRQEVRKEALHTFGILGSPGEIIQSSHKYLLDFRVMLREGVLLGFYELMQRYPNIKKESWYKEFEKEIDEFLITSVSVHPYFPLKEKYVRLQERLNREAEI